MNYDVIGKFIQERRKEIGLTQKELANKIGVTDKAVSKWETGLGCPDVSILEILSKELNCSILELLKGREIKEEVIPITEMDDYIKTSLNYGVSKIKTILNKGIIFLIVFIAILLIILNMINIYNQNKIYYPEGIKMELDYYQNTIDGDLKAITKYMNIIKANRGKYSKEDYDYLIRSLDYAKDTITKNELLKYDGNGLTINDIYMINYEGNFYTPCIALFNILSKYDSSYTDMFGAVTNMYYSRNKFNMSNTNMIYEYLLFSSTYMSDHNMPNIISTKMFETLSDVKLYKFALERIIEVGDIHE